MYDYNNASFYYPLDLVMDIDNEFPNITLTTLPIKFLQARYYEEIDSFDIAKKMYLESMNVNPYLTAPEAELAGLYFKEKKYDSAYYYSKIAFDNIPNSNVNRHAYFEILTHNKDTIELSNAFTKLKEYDNESHWIEYMMNRFDIVGPNDEHILETLKEYKTKFNIENDNPTKILESIFKVGTKNLVISVSLSLKADSLFQEKKYIESATLYEYAIDVDKNDYTFYENAALAYNLAGDYEKAKLYFDKVINEFKPMNGKSEFYKGIMMIKLDDLKSGCMLLSQAVNLKYSGMGSLEVYNNFCN
jgi:tetratricopeptide (TPR) repeat protein